jgi:hypothetical protein
MPFKALSAANSPPPAGCDPSAFPHFGKAGLRAGARLPGPEDDADATCRGDVRAWFLAAIDDRPERGRWKATAASERLEMRGGEHSCSDRGTGPDDGRQGIRQTIIQLVESGFHLSSLLEQLTFDSSELPADLLEAFVDLRAEAVDLDLEHANPVAQTGDLCRDRGHLVLLTRLDHHGHCCTVNISA